MSANHTVNYSQLEIGAALAVGTVGVLMVGIQPILLGELVDSHMVSLEGVGIVAMAEIIALGIGVVLGDTLLPGARLRRIAIIAAALVAFFDVLTLAAVNELQMTAVRAAAGVVEGVLVWGATGVVVRTENPARIAGIFFIVQTIAQAVLGMLLANVVIPHRGWQGGFATLGALTLLSCSLAYLQPARLTPLATTEATGFRWTVAAVLTLAVVFLQLATLGSFWAYLEPISKAVGFDAREAQSLISGVLVMQVLGGVVATAAVRRLAGVPTLLAASAGLAVVAITTYLLPNGSTLQFTLGCALFGFVWLFMLPFHIGLALQVEQSGRLAGLVPAAQLLGSAFGPLTASFIVEGENATAVPLLSATFAVAAAAILLFGRLHQFSQTGRGHAL